MSGGNKGFNKVLWEVVEYKNDKNPSVTFKYHSKDGEEGKQHSFFKFFLDRGNTIYKRKLHNLSK